jgi:CBS domain-containing protein
MKIAELMTHDPQPIAPDDTLKRAAELMDALDVGVLPVCDGERLVGMITDRDIVVRATAAGLAPEASTVGDIMTADLRWAYEDEDVDEAERMMRDTQIRRLPVLNRQRRLVGMLSLGDLASKGAPAARETLDAVSRPPAPDR